MALFIALTLISHFSVHAQTITAFPQDKVVYNLPYPGILPDNPLYIVKIIRDRIWEFVTRDNLKKAELFLLFSDKRVAMAESLADKGKEMLAVSTLSKAEKYFQQIPDLMKNSKKQGVAASADFVNKVKASNIKHQEVIATFLKELPQGQADALNVILNLNLKTKKDLQSL